MKENLQDLQRGLQAGVVNLLTAMQQALDTYAARLDSAMKAAGFGDVGGQSRLAKAIGCRSQTINQALNGSVLSAIYHVRACIRLGVMPLWLSEGRGPRFDAAGPRAALPGEEDPLVLPSQWLANAERSGEGVGRHVSDGSFEVDFAERALLQKLRRNPDLRQSVVTLVNMASPDLG